MTRFGCYLPAHGVATPSMSAVLDVARAAERAGFAHVWTGDHLTWNREMFAPVPMLAQVAMVTQRIALGIGVYLLPLRNPVLAAKELATLDRLSDGRLLLGVGIAGENPDEYAAAGLPATGLGRRLEDALDVVEAAWGGQPLPATKTFGILPDAPIAPCPAGHVPLWVGGRSSAAVDRAVRRGDGWFAMWVSPARVRSERARMTAPGFRVAINAFTCVADDDESATRALRAQIESAYRMPYNTVSNYTLAGGPHVVAGRIQEYVDAGVTNIVFNIAGEDVEEQIERLATQVVPLVRSGG